MTPRLVVGMYTEARPATDMLGPQVTLAADLAVISIVFLVQFSGIYSRANISIDSAGLASYEKAAPMTFVVVISGIALSLYGVYKLQASWQRIHKPSGILKRAQANLANALIRQPRVFWSTLAAYALFFAFASGMTVYGSQSFSERYGIQAIPSYHIIGCCGQPGAYPVLTIYITQNFGLLLVPSDLVLLAFLPLLVAMNVSLLAFRAKSRQLSGPSGTSVGKELSACGASAGILAGCPTCAASVFLALAGSGGALGISSLALATLQPVFVLASFASLIAAPILTESRIPLRSIMRL